MHLTWIHNQCCEKLQAAKPVRFSGILINISLFIPLTRYYHYCHEALVAEHTNATISLFRNTFRAPRAAQQCSGYHWVQNPTWDFSGWSLRGLPTVWVGFLLVLRAQYGKWRHKITSGCELACTVMNWWPIQGAFLPLSRWPRGQAPARPLNLNRTILWLTDDGWTDSQQLIF